MRSSATCAVAAPSGIATSPAEVPRRNRSWSRCGSHGLPPAHFGIVLRQQASVRSVDPLLPQAYTEPVALGAEPAPRAYAFATTSPTSTFSKVTKSPGA